MRKQTDIYDRRFWIGPAVVTVVFVVTTIVLLVLVRSQQAVQHRQEVANEYEVTLESLKRRLAADRDYLGMLAPEIGRGAMTEPEFRMRVTQYVGTHAGLANVTYADNGFVIRWTAPYEPNKQVIGLKLALPEPKQASHAARDTHRPVYTHVFMVVQGFPALEVYVPVYDEDRFVGTVGGIYNLNDMMRSLIPEVTLRNYRVELVDGTGRILFGAGISASEKGEYVREQSFDLTGADLSLRLTRRAEPIGVRGVDALVTLSIALALGMAWGMRTLRRYIAERKKIEETLRKNEEVLLTFVEHSPAAIAMFDHEMNYIVASRRFLLDYDLGDQDVTGHSHYEVFPEISERWREIHRRCLAGAIEKSEEDLFPRLDGTMDWVRWEIHPWHEIDGKIGGIILFSEVITGRKKAEDELRRTNEELLAITAENARMLERIVQQNSQLENTVQERTAELEENQTALLSIVEDLSLMTEELKVANEQLKDVDRLKSMFIASMSHELRTPLNSIIGFTGIILQGMAGEINEEQRDQLQRVLKAGKHLLALVTDVIDVSKIESGKIEAFIDEFPLDTLLNEALSNLKIPIKEKGLEIEVVTHPDKIFLKIDRKRLLQAVLNYLSNAVKFTEKGKITILAEEKGGEFELKVTDTGIGINEADLPLLFQPFVRLESPLKMTVTGTGLGLYLTKKLVTEVLGGEVSVTSEYGKGSTFGMKMPGRGRIRESGVRSQESEFRRQNEAATGKKFP